MQIFYLINSGGVIYARVFKLEESVLPFIVGIKNTGHGDISPLGRKIAGIIDLYRRQEFDTLRAAGGGVRYKADVIVSRLTLGDGEGPAHLN